MLETVTQLNQERRSRKPENLTGKRFGALRVLKRVANVGKKTRWVVRCDCGNEQEVYGQNLINRTAWVKRDCGKCVDRRIDFTNRRFGQYVVLGRGADPFTWMIRCDCGNEKQIKQCNLGSTKSCGCLIYKKLLSVEVTGFRAIVNNYKKNAQSRSFIWELTEDDCRRLFAGDCHYCGAPPSNQKIVKSYYRAPRRQTGEFIYNGIDRMDSSRGYTVANCVSCCGRCNRAKMEMNAADFIAMAVAIAERAEGRKCF